MIILRHQKTFPLRVAEWLLAGVLFNWGVVILFHPGILAGRDAFTSLILVAPEKTWGVTCLLLGIIRTVVLTINGAWRPTPHIRALTAFLSCFIWMMICFALANNAQTSLGIATYPLFLVLESYSVNRAMTDARLADDEARRKVQQRA